MSAANSSASCAHDTRSDLGFRVAGKITQRLVNVGDRVRAGDVVARLDAEDLKPAGRERARRTVGRDVERRPDRGRRAALRTLRARGYAAVADYDRKKTAKDEAAGRLERAQRALDLARNQFAYAELKADADGVITATLGRARTGGRDRPGVVRLAHRGDKEALVALPETWLGEARTVESPRSDCGRTRPPVRRQPARAVAAGGRRDPHLRGALHRSTDPDDTVALGMTATVTLAHAQRR